MKRSGELRFGEASLFPMKNIRICAALPLKDLRRGILPSYAVSSAALIFDEEDFSVRFPRMKRELADLLDREMDTEEKETELDRFFAGYTTAKVYKQNLLGEKR